MFLEPISNYNGDDPKRKMGILDLNEFIAACLTYRWNFGDDHEKSNKNTSTLVLQSSS